MDKHIEMNNEENIEIGSEKPIIREFAKTTWKMEKQSFRWDHLEIKFGNKIRLIDKSGSTFTRLFSGKASSIIPKDFKNYEKLVTELKKKIATAKK